MAFQSHSIPWHVLSQILEYRAARSTPGPQYATITFQRQSSLVLQLEYFARTFQDVVREHVVGERRRFQSAATCAARAKSWVISAGAYDNSSTPTAKLVTTSGAYLDHEQRIQKNYALRKMQTALSEGTWTNSIEERYVYPKDFVEEYCNVPKWSSKRQHHMSFLQDEFGRAIQDWIQLSTNLSSQAPTNDAEYLQLRNKEYNHGDVLKLLITDAAMTRQADRHKHLVETLLLLAHHPRIKLERYAWLSMSCCNMSCGFDNIATFALKAFLLLNVMASMQEAGTVDFTRRVDSATVFDKHVEIEVPSKSQWTLPGSLPYIELMPRPHYMNLKVWADLVAQVCHEHENLAETVFFSKMLFPPRSEDGMPEEIDLFSDRIGLRSQLKRMWWIMLVVDMIMRETGHVMNWEYMVLSALSQLFGWPLGEKYVDYEIRRQGWTGNSEDRHKKEHDFYHYYTHREE